MMSFIRQYWKTIVLTIVILFLSLFRFGPIHPLQKVPNSDKIIHLLMYACFAFIIHWEYSQAKDKIDVLHRYILICFAFPIFLGGLIEILQSTDFIGRHGDVYDFIANTLGVFVGWIIFKVYNEMKLKT